MKSKNQLFNSAAGIFTFIFLIISVVAFGAGELIFGIAVGGNTLYISIFFIVVVLASAIFMTIMLFRADRKTFLYILFCLPLLIFIVIRFFDLFAPPMGYLVQIITHSASAGAIVMFLISLQFAFRETYMEALSKKKEKLEAALKE